MNVERAQGGDRDAFGSLYATYGDTVYRYVYYRVGGKATAEDLTSEALYVRWHGSAHSPGRAGTLELGS